MSFGVALAAGVAPVAFVSTVGFAASAVALGETLGPFPELFAVLAYEAAGKLLGWV